jgi:hypothetical protein
MIRRPKLPTFLADAIGRAWPDGVVEMIDLEEAPLREACAKLKGRLSRIPGSDLVFEREAAGRPRWGENADSDEDPPEWDEPARSYHLFFLSPKDRHYSFDTETVEPDDEGIEQRFAGQGRIGHVVAVSLVAPFALVAIDQFEVFESGSYSEPSAEAHLFDLDGTRLDMERHYMDVFEEEGPLVMQGLAKQREKIARILKALAISIIPEKHLNTPVPGLRAGEGVLKDPKGTPLTVRVGWCGGFSPAPRRV